MNSFGRRVLVRVQAIFGQLGSTYQESQYAMKASILEALMLPSSLLKNYNQFKLVDLPEVFEAAMVLVRYFNFI